MVTVLLSLTGILLLAAFVLTLRNASGREPLWIAVLLLTLANLVSLLFGAGVR